VGRWVVVPSAPFAVPFYTPPSPRLFSKCRLSQDKPSLETADTARIVSRLIPDAVDLCRRGAGEVIFSALAPGSHISAHCAPTDFRLTAHVGLSVPHGTGCRIRVGEEEKCWEQGKVLVFDDSFEHEIWNDTDETRIVLLIRFWHPELSNHHARTQALTLAQEKNEHSLRIRKFPPLPPRFEALESILTGETACPGCGNLSTAKELHFGHPPATAKTVRAASPTTEDENSGSRVNVKEAGGVWTSIWLGCSCGAELT